MALSKKLDLSYWKVRTMTQKICKTMRDLDASYKLAVIVGIDASFLSGPKGRDKRGKGGSKCIVIIETSSNSEGIGYVRITVVKGNYSISIMALVKTDIKENQMCGFPGSLLC